MKKLLESESQGQYVKLGRRAPSGGEGFFPSAASASISFTSRAIQDSNSIPSSVIATVPSTVEVNVHWKTSFNLVWPQVIWENKLCVM